MRQLPIEAVVSRISKQLHMNELEIAIWAVWVEQNNWRDSSVSFDNFFVLTGYQVKVLVVVTARSNT